MINPWLFYFECLFNNLCSTFLIIDCIIALILVVWLVLTLRFKDYFICLNYICKYGLDEHTVKCMLSSLIAPCLPIVVIIGIFMHYDISQSYLVHNLFSLLFREGVCAECAPLSLRDYFDFIIGLPMFTVSLYQDFRDFYNNLPDNIQRAARVEPVSHYFPIYPTYEAHFYFTETIVDVWSTKEPVLISDLYDSLAFCVSTAMPNLDGFTPYIEFRQINHNSDLPYDVLGETLHVSYAFLDSFQRFLINARLLKLNGYDPGLVDANFWGFSNNFHVGKSWKLSRVLGSISDVCMNKSFEENIAIHPEVINSAPIVGNQYPYFKLNTPIRVPFSAENVIIYDQLSFVDHLNLNPSHPNAEAFFHSRRVAVEDLSDRRLADRHFIDFNPNSLLHEQNQLQFEQWDEFATLFNINHNLVEGAPRNLNEDGNLNTSLLASVPNQDIPSFSNCIINEELTNLVEVSNQAEGCKNKALISSLIDRSSERKILNPSGFFSFCCGSR